MPPALPHAADRGRLLTGSTFRHADVNNLRTTPELLSKFDNFAPVVIADTVVFPVHAPGSARLALLPVEVQLPENQKASPGNRPGEALFEDLAGDQTD